LIKRYAIILIALIMLLSTGGVYATWQYAYMGSNPAGLDITIRLGEFNWAGSGDLPTDDAIGEDHLALIQQIINHPQHGLNTSGSYLNDQIKDRQDGGIGWSGGRDTLGSMAVTQSEELTEIFGLDSSNLDFLIQFKSDTEYYIFTTGEDLGERGEINIWGNNKTPGKPNVPIGGNIYPIYRTKIVKTNGTWAAVETKVGYATSAWYEESRRNATATQIPSFDPDTFKEGKPA
jgi:hypothetical protein